MLKFRISKGYTLQSNKESVLELWYNDWMKDLLSIQYNLNITAITELARLDASNGNKLFKVEAGRHSFFLKEIPEHSKSAELDHIYHELHTCRPQSFKMILPLKNKEGHFLLKTGDQEMMLYPFVEHMVLAEVNLELKRILQMLNELFTVMKPLDLCAHPFKTYQNWFLRGPAQLGQKVGDHQILHTLKKFTDKRFEQLQFKSGNIHGDLNPYNIWTNEEGELFVTDIDNAQNSAFMKDIFDSCGKFLRLTVNEASISESELEDIFIFAQEYCANLTREDVKFLLVRPKLGALFDPNSKFSIKDVIAQLNHLNTFLT